MSSIDQCPSTTKGEKKQASKQELAAGARELQRLSGNGPRVWRSLDEVADTSEFRDFVEREFPAGASELLNTSRRGFVQLMGASLALAGAATIPGCRRPDHKIYSYSREVPEEIVPGKPLYYSTSMSIPGALGGAEGLLIETHEGRPTKAEGNPLHPVNNGKSSIFAQASILQMYDPDRLKYPMFKNAARGRVQATWDDFRAWWETEAAAYEASRGAGLAFLVEKKTSPTRDVVRDELKKKYPSAWFAAYDSVEPRATIDGSTIAFGAPMQALYDFSKARTILSIGRDFLDHNEPNVLPQARQFAKSREVWSGKDGMSRLYVVESGYSMTGGQADHRLRLKPTLSVTFAVELARYLLPKLAAPSSVVDAANACKVSGEIDRRFLEECAKDLLQGADRSARAGSIVIPGHDLPAEVQALIHAVNIALGSTVASYSTISEENARDSAASLKELAGAIDAGKVTTLVCLGVNPVYDAPGEMEIEKSLGKLKNLITLSVESTETASLSTWSLNGAHALESWGDTRATDGTIAPIQPMIAPLYEPALTDIELLGYFAGIRRADKTPTDGYELVRSAWKKLLGEGDFEKLWRRALHDGVVAGVRTKFSTPDLDAASVAKAIGGYAAGESKGMDVVFRVGHLHDGRYANHPWLQELPQQGTTVVWDNPALVSPATASKLKLAPVKYNDAEPGDMYTITHPKARVAKLTIGGRSVEVPVWILPGMADDTILLTLGYGRRECGAVGEGVGVNLFPMRSAATSMSARGATLEPTGVDYFIASTQNHWSLEGRSAIVRSIDLPVWTKYGDQEAKPIKDDIYERVSGKLSLGEKLGELSHTPPNLSIYVNPQNRSEDEPDPKNLSSHPKDLSPTKKPTPPVFSTRAQWGMTIDLSTCTGCGTCTIACQAENNIPVVGKKEVAKGREMTWIRVDRYFTGDSIHDPEAMYHQPVACVHCENAPCETVCPVNATVHGPEGHNMMTYNRCIGTRYCANNCPYKVRRFNFFEYGLHKFNGGWEGRELMQGIIELIPGKKVGDPQQSFNPNLIPPRLRQKLDEISKMQKNPDVSVRMRGVMEKCTYCVQRTNFAKIESKLHELEHIPEGFVQTACQQACPSNSIVFGDILDPESAVSKTRANQRSYLLLGYLNTRPRTSHLIAVKNPNPELATDSRKNHWEHPFDHGGGHGESHGDGHGDGHGSEGDHAPKAEHSFFFDRRKSREDRGYAGSLNVLSGVNA
jgi:MoCo/4Fe-4S cofactor protein with predicted Tat translocation signal